ncbi:MAG: DUF4382 domain-containing protein [Saprospiraceae bacterium]|nr:DUF4382 domain-containing protein [Saprospiraceae bacterium]
MLRKTLVVSALGVFSLLAITTSCSDNVVDGETVFNLRMTDDPLQDVQAVNIDLQTVIVITEEGRDSFEMNTNSGIYNLLDYQGGLDTLIATTTLNALSIHQIRLVLGEENSIMVDSVLHDLKTPSAQQSGLKLNVQADLQNIDVYDLLIDFDAEESVVEQGNGQYILKPVIRIVE